MKKIQTLIALMLAMFMGAKAELVQDYKIDYSDYFGFPFYVMSYVPEWNDGVMTDLGAMYTYVAVEDAGEADDIIVTTLNGSKYKRIALDSPQWHQYFIADGIPTEFEGPYIVKAMVKASEPCTINVNMGWGWNEGQQLGASVSIGTEWEEVVWEYSGVEGAACNLVAQPGTVTATIEWKSVTVCHRKKETKPTIWQEWLTSDGQPVIVDGNPIPTYMGDAETPWADPNVRFDDQENNYKICAWSREKGRNMNEYDGWDPFPSDIEEVDGNHVFVCHGQPATSDGAASAWDNQFWIQSPKAWKSGDQVKIHFRYKASAPVSSTDTQIHYQTPTDFLIWHAIGNIAFTEEWQEFDDVLTIADDMAGGWSIAFNLNSVVKDAVTFYFDDLSWQSMKLDEGYFVAGSNPNTGLDYDFDNAVQFVFDEAEQLYIATIGEKDEYVSQVMISTVRGNDITFKSNTLKPIGTIENDPNVWLDYSVTSHAMLNLPGEGVWKIFIDEEYKAMAFQMIEGNMSTLVEINPNPTHVIIDALERDDLADGYDWVNEEPGGTGQIWDNQFWIVSNRPLSAGETTIVQFKYKSSIPATTSTQCHSSPGYYLHWAAIGNVNFTEEWRDFETTFTVPGEADGMKSIAFNLAEIKAANRYELKDIVWKLEDNTESLIDQEGSQNFYFKVVGGKIEVFSTLSVESEPLHPGMAIDLPISLSIGSEMLYNGYQFDITLPSGMTLAMEGGQYAYTLADDRYTDAMEVSIIELDENQWRVMVYPLDDALLVGLDGEIITLSLTADEDIADGNYTVNINNILLSRISGDDLAIPDLSFNIEVTNSYAPGDVNHDGSVNVTDVMLTVSAILGHRLDAYHPEQADVNNDGAVGITDVAKIIDFILHAPSTIPSDVDTPLEDLGGFAGGGDPASAD